jgi:hypothetical protein
VVIVLFSVGDRESLTFLYDFYNIEDIDFSSVSKGYRGVLFKYIPAYITDTSILCNLSPSERQRVLMFTCNSFYYVLQNLREAVKFIQNPNSLDVIHKFFCYMDHLKCMVREYSPVANTQIAEVKKYSDRKSGKAGEPQRSQKRPSAISCEDAVAENIKKKSKVAAGLVKQYTQDCLQFVESQEPVHERVLPRQKPDRFEEAFKKPFPEVYFNKLQLNLSHGEVLKEIVQELREKNTRMASECAVDIVKKAFEKFLPEMTPHMLFSFHLPPGKKQARVTTAYKLVHEGFYRPEFKRQIKRRFQDSPSLTQDSQDPGRA